MSALLSHTDVRRQSESVFRQFGPQWERQAKENARLKREPAEALREIGVGRIAVLVAAGASLEGHIETLRKYRDRFDLYACDKAFGILAEQGIFADAVHIADANIPFKWLEPHIEKTRGVRLISTAYANPEWTKAWLGPRTFYVNADAIDSQNLFAPIMGEGTRVVAASSNISNAMVVFLTGCLDQLKDNFAGYERYLLVGYDYSWRADGNYYAFANPVPKRHYMTHMAMNDVAGDAVRTSENLVFSAKWLWSYLAAYQFLPVVNCSGRGLLDIGRQGVLDEELRRIKTDPSARQRIIDALRVARATRDAHEAAEHALVRAKEAILWQ